MLSLRKALGRASMSATAAVTPKKKSRRNKGYGYFGGYGYGSSNNDLGKRSSKRIRMANRRTAIMRRRMLAIFSIGLLIIGFNFHFRHPNVSLSGIMTMRTTHTNNNINARGIPVNDNDNSEHAIARAAATAALLREEKPVNFGAKDKESDSLATAEKVRESHLEAVKRSHAAAVAASKDGVVETVQRCYRSKSSGASVCVYQGDGLGNGGLCIGAGGLVNLSNNGTGNVIKTGVQQRTEEVSELPVTAHETATYIGKRKVLWYEPAIIVLHASSKCGSIVQFAKRIAIVYHILRHHKHYFPVPKNGNNVNRIKRIGVVIIAHPKVLGRLKYSRSWHRALIDALAYPGRPDLRRNAALRFARSHFAGPPRVFVLPSFKAMSPDPRYRVAAHKWPVACLKRLAFGASSETGFALEKAQYPQPEILADTKNVDDDNQALRKALFKAVLNKEAPPARRRLVYVHRGRNRSFGTSDTARVERLLENLARTLGFSYTRLDSDGLPVSAVLAGTGDAGLIVGIHGTTLLSTQFLGKGSGIVEIFPYKFVNTLYARRELGDNVLYTSMALSVGDDYVGKSDFNTVEECQTLSVRCRNWYRSDNRPLRFLAEDARTLEQRVTQAAAYVKLHTAKE